MASEMVVEVDRAEMVVEVDRAETVVEVRACEPRNPASRGTTPGEMGRH
jgi:hypothetical protein